METLPGDAIVSQKLSAKRLAFVFSRSDFGSLK